jgi:hypothetical protein
VNNVFNFIFYLFLIIGFILPSNSSFYISSFGILLKYNELAFLSLPFINLLCYSKYQLQPPPLQLKKYIFYLISIILISELLLKGILFEQSFFESFQSLRICFPLLSSLILIYQGIRVNYFIFWKVFLLCITVSIIISFFSIFIFLPIYFEINDSNNILELLGGRLSNDNSSFGIIGFYLLFQENKKWYNDGYLVKITSILSIFSLIFTFNRTYIFLLFISLIYVILNIKKINQLFKILIFLFLSFFFLFKIYSSSNVIKVQVDRRIISIVNGSNSLNKNAIKNNRDIIYKGVVNEISNGYWLFGMPFKRPIFYWSRFGMKVTDTSVFTFILRYGIIPFLLLFSIFYQLYLNKKLIMFRYIFFIYLIASLNVDSLVRQNSIFFLSIIFLVDYNRQINNIEKHSF